MTIRRELLVNNASTTLNGAINASTTSITVTDGTVFPSTGNFRILIGSEIMSVTARSTHVLTVVRGEEGTTGASHSDLDPVTAILTAGAIERFWDDANPFKPSAMPTPFRIANSSGTILTSSDFTWYNQGTATITDNTSGTLVLTAPDLASTHQWRGMERTPSGTPWELRAFLMAGVGYIETDTFFGLYMRESATDKLITCHFRMDSVFACSDWTNSTTFTSTNTSGDCLFDRYWIKMTDDGTNITVAISINDLTYYTLLNEARGTFFTTGPDRYGFGISAYNAELSTVDMHILAWEES